jgi:hypothetical protein
MLLQALPDDLEGVLAALWNNAILSRRVRSAGQCLTGTFTLALKCPDEQVEFVGLAGE